MNTSAKEVSNSSLLELDQWLLAHSVKPELFAEESFRGEDDPLLGDAFVSLSEYEKYIRGDPVAPGRRFILAYSGAGKSSLRRRIKSELEAWDKSIARILVVEYVEHHYKKSQSDVVSHVRRIRDLISIELGKRTAKEEPQSPVPTLRSSFTVERTVLRKWIDDHFDLDELLMLCQEFGLDLDNIAGKRKKEKIASLLQELGKMNRIQELVEYCRRERSEVAWPPELIRLEDKGSYLEIDESAVSPRTLLENALVQCQAQGFSTVYILVDNVALSDREDQESVFHRILPLVQQTDLLSIRGLVFKFLLPAELSSDLRLALPTHKFPCITVKWDTWKQLKDVLAGRWEAGLSDESRRLGGSGLGGPLAELCDERLAATIGDELTRFGLAAGNPRAMWQLGYYLLDEHFRQSATPYLRGRDEYVGLAALYGAYHRLGEEVVAGLGQIESRQARMSRVKSLCERIVHLADQDDIDRELEASRPISELWLLTKLAVLRRASYDDQNHLLSHKQCNVERDRAIRELRREVDKWSQ